MDSIVNACMQDYTKVINNSPMLTKKQERSLVRIIHRFKSGKAKQEAREKMFHANLKLVMKRANFYSLRSKAPFADLVQAGMVGLGHAIDRFNPVKFKTRFSTYAVSWIQLKIFDTLAEFENMVHVPQNIAIKARQYKKILMLENSKDLSDSNIMKMLESSEHVFRNIKAVNSSVVSLESPFLLSRNGGGRDKLNTLKDNIRDPRHISVSDIMEKQENRQILKIALNTLKPLQKEILTLRYLDNEKNKLVKLGRKYNLTGERIRQIECKALKILRVRLKDRSLFNIS